MIYRGGLREAWLLRPQFVVAENSLLAQRRLYVRDPPGARTTPTTTNFSSHLHSCD